MGFCPFGLSITPDGRSVAPRKPQGTLMARGGSMRRGSNKSHRRKHPKVSKQESHHKGKFESRPEQVADRWEKDMQKALRRG
jgi:hypothetical protein